MTKPRSPRFSIVLLYAVGSILLIAGAASIFWHFLTTKFPAHSDVFWTGVQCGILGALSLILLAFGLLFLYRIIMRLLKP